MSRSAPTLALLALPALLCLAGCGEETPAPAPRAADPSIRLPQQVLEGIHLVQSDVSGSKWVLEAARGVSYGPKEPVALEDLRIDFLDAEGRVRSTLTSRSGEIDRTASRLMARDQVRVVSVDGDVLETDRLDWIERTKQIVTDAPFRLTRGADVLTGVGIETDPELRAYSITSGVRATVVSGALDRALEEEPPPPSPDGGVPR